MCDLRSFYDKFIRCKMLKRPISLAIQSDRRSIDVRRETALAQADVSGGRHIGFLSLSLFFSYLLRGERAFALLPGLAEEARRTTLSCGLSRRAAAKCVIASS